MTEDRYCLVCKELVSREPYFGYYFCNNHKWLEQFDPEELEMVVMFRLGDGTPEQIEKYYGQKWLQKQIDVIADKILLGQATDKDRENAVKYYEELNEDKD